MLPLAAKHKWETGCSYAGTEKEGIISLQSNSSVKSYYKNHSVATSAI